MYYDQQKRKENYDYYIRRGRCPKCGGKNPVEPGKHVCRECSMRQSEQRRDKRAWRRKNGLCTRCGKPIPDESKFIQCQECREYLGTFSVFNFNRYNARKEQGKCVKCGNWAEPGETLCRKCKEYHIQYARKFGENIRERKRQRRQERIVAGLCIDCGQPTDDGHTRCPRCRDMRMDSTRKYRIQKRIEREAREARNR